MAFPPGTVGILSSDLTRYAWFSQTVLAMQLPSGTKVEWVTGHWVSVAVNLLFKALEGEWLCILADDHWVPPDLIPRMLAHNVAIAAPLCALRRPPFRPSLFHDDRLLGMLGYEWHELTGQAGLVPVAAMGGPGMVIRREVIDTMGAPWFENMPGQREVPSEDLYFFRKCRKLGFQPYCDLDLAIGHILPMTLFPQRGPDGRYQLRVWNNQDIATVTP
jgi:hypothetical protein